VADWQAVDRYIEDRLLGVDPVLEAALAANAAAGLPAIDVSPAQGRMLHLFARMAGARRILEVGTLGGYSTICLGRALPPGGRMISLEIDPHHAGVARRNLAAGGLDGCVEVRVGPALESLARLKADSAEPFDFVFIDADKENNAAYVRAALDLSRPGTAILVDNVVREGGVLDARSEDPRIIGTRELFDLLSTETRLDCTAVQTVGAKKWDGFVLALVKG
jgi:predicted O-methyltransferase YrrM